MIFIVLIVVCSCESDIPVLKERHNLYDYTVGQANIADKYCIPLCDLYGESGINLGNKDLYISKDNLHYTNDGYAFISSLTTEFIRQYGGTSDLFGKSIGVFGGSFALIPASSYCKDVWVNKLGVKYTDYAVEAAGFSTLTINTIDSQVDEAAIHDIYILWCSTNDCLKNAPIGSVDSKDPNSQSFGMSKTIDKLLQKNPMAKVLIFNSIKSYKYDYLYDQNAERY